MTKLLISLYILVILMIAGFAHADGIANTRIGHIQQIFLPVQDAHLESTYLKITGPINHVCKANNKVKLQFRSSGDTLTAFATAPIECLQNADDTYEVGQEMNAYFAQNPVNQDAQIKILIENYDQSFNYIARASAHFDFDKKVEGTIAWSRISGYSIQTPEGTVSLMPTFNLKSYVNKKVQVQAEVNPGFAVAPHQDQPSLLIGQLAVLK